VLAKTQAKKYRGVYQSTVGLIFFGTPFRGAHSDFHSQGWLLERASQLNAQMYQQNYEVFRPGDTSLTDTVDEFHDAVSEDIRPRTLCFFEKSYTNLGVLVKSAEEVSDTLLYVTWPHLILEQERQVMLVDEHTGALDSNEKTEKWGRACDHLGVNKFSSVDQDFRRLKTHLRRVIEEGREVIEGKTKSEYLEFSIHDRGRETGGVAALESARKCEEVDSQELSDAQQSLDFTSGDSVSGLEKESLRANAMVGRTL
jgi:hypothetical protein